MNKYLTPFVLCMLLIFLGNCKTPANVSPGDNLTSPVRVRIDADEILFAVSPLIYGKNNSFDKAPSFYDHAGLRFARMCGGNNATKYNWQDKISSHPDWYNNVYANDWDSISQSIEAEHPDIQVMWAFSMIGRVASSRDYNFNDWGYNRSQWWQGVGQNLAGGGEPNTVDPGAKAEVEGDINLYTKPWSTDDTVGILDHWFGAGGIGLDKNQFIYWNMDNEPDIWNGTHDDVMPQQISASDFMDRYIEIALKAKAKFPEIKLCGPVTTSEWQWFVWGDERIYVNGTYYSWLEYFIKRLADAETEHGVRLLDVVDLHNYPYAPNREEVLQVHRVYYDQDYIYPGANGVKTINGGWDNSQNKEYIFLRIEQWLDQYFGEDHGITLGLSEWGPSTDDPNLCSVVYGSILGTFANHGVEFFSPWNWSTGMWETLHLFSRYSRENSVSSVSSDEEILSAYSTVNDTGTAMTIILINRDLNESREVTVQVDGLKLAEGPYTTLQLASLPSSETFISHSDNALTEHSIDLSGETTFTITVPALSTTAVLLGDYNDL